MNAGCPQSAIRVYRTRPPSSRFAENRPDRLTNGSGVIPGSLLSAGFHCSSCHTPGTRGYGAEPSVSSGPFFLEYRLGLPQGQYGRSRKEEMMPMGSPRKYREIIEELEEDELYTAASIARFAASRGLLDRYVAEGGDEKLAEQRIRIAMGRTRANHLPDEGDGLVTLKDRHPTPGWYGWRWKETQQTFRFREDRG